ncbi:hypothetical protein BofuT4_P114390.1 [Botrytis cinerea T4]|uniref:Uncharacterized protein n=1 Tax=Botryotinia fuckeliana (strain T4) TaxID=999810 RepID=G2Y2L0_BOTF4|nr:hypothetical protein BofuT4_P114390.1 [Botrytis cinerea T4]
MTSISEMSTALIASANPGGEPLIKCHRQSLNSHRILPALICLPPRAAEHSPKIVQCIQSCSDISRKLSCVCNDRSAVVDVDFFVRIKPNVKIQAYTLSWNVVLKIQDILHASLVPACASMPVLTPLMG